jgi:hypothetical protein
MIRSLWFYDNMLSSKKQNPFHVYYKILLTLLIADHIAGYFRDHDFCKAFGKVS